MKTNRSSCRRDLHWERLPCTWKNKLQFSSTENPLRSNSLKMLRVFTYTVICSSSNSSIDFGWIAARIFGPKIGKLGATNRRRSKNVSPYCGAFPGLTMMRSGSVLFKLKWTPVAASFSLASIRRNLPTAARNFCLCRSNLAPGEVNGKLPAASLCVGHNPICKRHVFQFFFCGVRYIPFKLYGYEQFMYILWTRYVQIMYMVCDVINILWIFK